MLSLCGTLTRMRGKTTSPGSKVPHPVPDLLQHKQEQMLPACDSRSVQIFHWERCHSRKRQDVKGWPIPIIMITSGTRWVRQKMESNHVPYCWLGEQEKFGELMAVWCQASLAIALCIQLPEYGDKLNLWKIMVFTSLVIKTAYLYFFHFYSALYLKKKKMYKRNSIQMYQMPWGVCILSRLAFLERKWCWIAVVLVRV